MYACMFMIVSIKAFFLWVATALSLIPPFTELPQEQELTSHSTATEERQKSEMPDTEANSSCS